jgi:hypothetical protein
MDVVACADSPDVVMAVVATSREKKTSLICALAGTTAVGGSLASKGAYPEPPPPGEDLRLEWNITVFGFPPHTMLPEAELLQPDGVPHILIQSRQKQNLCATRSQKEMRETSLLTTCLSKSHHTSSIHHKQACFAHSGSWMSKKEKNYCHSPAAGQSAHFLLQMAACSC